MYASKNIKKTYKKPNIVNQLYLAGSPPPNINEKEEYRDKLRKQLVKVEPERVKHL